jgi:flagellar motility protein MotE (MotC chaperone)
MRLRLLPIVLIALVAVLGWRSLDALRRAEVSPVGVARAAGPAPAPAAPAGGAPPAAAAPAAPAVTHQRPAEAQVPTRPGADAALNERLAERRRQLDERMRDIDQREALLRAAERRLEERVEELRRLEQRVEQAGQQREEQQNTQLRGLVTMYETMRPAEAARIFDRLDREVLITVATRMNPRRMAEVLAAMQPDAAQRLTVELARRAGGGRAATPAPAANPAGAAPTPAPGGRELQRIDQPRRPS